MNASAPPEPPKPTPRSQRWGMAELQRKVDWLLQNTPTGEVYTLELKDIEFNEQINVRQLLGTNDKTSKIVCPFAWRVRGCTFLRGLIARNIKFIHTFDFGNFEEIEELEDGTQIFSEIEDISNTEFFDKVTEFSGCEFSSNLTRFSLCLFASEQTFFNSIDFLAKRTYFSDCKFYSQNRFANINVKGNAFWFNDAKFLGSNTFLDNMYFNSKYTSINNLNLKNSTISISETSFYLNTYDFFDINIKDSLLTIANSNYECSSLDFNEIESINSNVNFINSTFLVSEINFNKILLQESQFSIKECTLTSSRYYTEELCIFNSKLDFYKLSNLGDSTIKFFKINFEDEKSKITLIDCNANNNENHQTSFINFEQLNFSEKNEKIAIYNNKLSLANVQVFPIYFFKNCSFQPGNVSISQLDLSEVEIKGGNGLNGFTFEHCHWPKRNVAGMRGWGLNLYCSPTDREESETKTKDQRENDALTYARLKEEAKSQGDAQLASHFHFWQLWNRYHAMPWEWGKLEKLVLWFYLATSAFGLSLIRPLLWLVIIWLFFGSIYALALSYLQGGYHPLAGGAHLDLNRWGEGLQLALSHSNPLENLDLIEILPKVGIAKEAIEPKLKGALGLLWHGLFWLGFMTQNALGLYLLFQFGAAARNKVRQ